MAMALSAFVEREEVAAPRSFRPSLPAASAARAAERYGYASATNRPAIAAVVISHVLLLWALVHFDVIAIRKAPPQRLAVTMVQIAPPPPPHEMARAAPPPKVAVTVIAPPPPAVPLPSPASAPIAVVPPAPAPVTPAPVAAVAAPAPLTTVGPAPVDIMADILDAPPPRFPAESRRLREFGTVRLRVTVSPEGRVAEVVVARSSGFDRLDAAAASAVRRWRFRPRVVAGAATEVIGFVPVTFNPPH